MKVLCAGLNLYGQLSSLNDVVIGTFKLINYDENSIDIELNHTYSVIKTLSGYEIRGLINNKTHGRKEIQFGNETENIVTSDGCGTLFLTQNGQIYKITEDCDNCNFIIKDISRFTNVEVMDKCAQVEKIIKVACGARISCAYSNHGYLYTIPTKLETEIPNVKDIRCGREHCLILTESGQVYSFGNGSRGQLGHGDLESFSEPKLIESLAGVKIMKIACGFWHSVVVSAFGDIYTWGWNSNGQIGLKTNKNHDGTIKVMATPQFLEIERNVIDVQTGSRHTIVLLDDKKLYGFGWNKYRQLGIDSITENIEELTFLYDLSNMKIKDLKCGSWNTAIVIDD